MFYIIGVAHQVQFKQEGADDSEDQKQFCNALASAIERFKPALVGEEFSEHALKQQGADYESLTKAVANSLRVEHRFCDPDADTRAKLKYREGTEIALELTSDRSLSNAEINDRGFAIEVAKYWPIREKFWLDQL